MNYDEEAIAKAQEKWRAQDMQTWGKRDAESIATRHEALLDLLCAHVPLEQNKHGTGKPKPPPKTPA